MRRNFSIELVLVFLFALNSYLLVDVTLKQDDNKAMSLDKIFEELIQCVKEKNDAKIPLLESNLCQQENQAIPFLIDKLGDDDFLVRVIAGKVLKKINDKSIMDKLAKKLEDGSMKDFRLGVSLFVDIGLSNKVNIFPVILGWLDSTSIPLVDASILAAETILELNILTIKENETIMNKIAAKINHQDENIKFSVILALQKIGHPLVIPYLIADLEEDLIECIKQTNKNRPLTDMQSKVLTNKIIDLASLCDQDFGYSIEQSLETNKYALEKQKKWYENNKNYLYHCSMGKVALNEEAKALGVPVNTETGKMIDTKDGHELTQDEIDKLKKEKREKDKNGIVVSRAIDGDTIELADGTKVRYIGIDTPETKDPRKPVEYFGREAAEANKELVEGKKVRLEYDVQKQDKYSRTLAYVYLEDGTFVNAWLVENGYARVSTYPPNVKYQELFLKLEQKAREQKNGLWAEPPPKEK